MLTAAPLPACRVLRCADEESRKKLGAFLVQAQLQGSVNSSAMFLTAAAQNLLCMKLAAEMGVLVASPWVTWFKAAVVPAVVGLLLTPLLMYKLFTPEIKDTPEAPKVGLGPGVLCEPGGRGSGGRVGAGVLSTHLATTKRHVFRSRPSPLPPQLAAERLAKMGPMSRNEKIMLSTMGAAVCLWVAGDALGITPVTTAMMGLCVLLLTGVLQWRECLAYPAAWDTLFWFAGGSRCPEACPGAGGRASARTRPAHLMLTPGPRRAVLVGMSGQLNSLGVINHFASGERDSRASNAHLVGRRGGARLARRRPTVVPLRVPHTLQPWATSSWPPRWAGLRCLGC